MKKSLIDAQPALEAARQALLDWLDGLIAKAPLQYQPGLKFVRDTVAAGSVIPAELVGAVLQALGDAVLKGNFGPATGDDSDLA